MGYTSGIGGSFLDARDVKRAIKKGELDEACLTIGWKADEWGYEITVFDARISQPVYEYTAGNSPWDSQQSVAPDKAVSEDKLREWAQQIATEFADEIGLPQSIVFEEED